MPGVLADQDRDLAEAGVHDAHLASAGHEALLVEDPVGREEELAIHPRQASPFRRELQVGRAVVQRAAVALVEAQAHVDRLVYRTKKAIPELANELFAAERSLEHAPLEEVAAGRGLRQQKHLDALALRLQHDLGDL